MTETEITPHERKEGEEQQAQGRQEVEAEAESKSKKVWARTHAVEVRCESMPEPRAIV